MGSNKYYYMKTSEIRNRILKILGEGDWMPSSKISSILRTNYYFVKEKLEELCDDGIIEKTEVPGGVYWRRKNEKV